MYRHTGVNDDIDESSSQMMEQFGSKACELMEDLHLDSADTAVDSSPLNVNINLQLSRYQTSYCR